MLGGIFARVLGYFAPSLHGELPSHVSIRRSGLNHFGAPGRAIRARRRKVLRRDRVSGDEARSPPARSVRFPHPVPMSSRGVRAAAKKVCREIWSKTKWTLINTRTQATLALGARWNGWGVFLSSSERNTLGEGVFSSPVLRSRTALLFLTKAQPFQRPRQQPQQLQLAAAATSSSCHNKATNPPQQHEHTCCCKNFPTHPPGNVLLFCCGTLVYEIQVVRDTTLRPRIVDCLLAASRGGAAASLR